MSKTKNLGQVSGVFIGKSAPKNTSIIWYDDTPSQMCHKVYDPLTNSWKVLSPDIVSNTTYSELVFNAKKNGLGVGKHYIITDKSNVLAVAVTVTKVQYPDSLGNIIIDDLGSNIQYHVSSGNLLIDDLSGVFNVETNKLVFQFQEQTNVNIETDYLFGKVRTGTKWILSKIRLSTLISKDVNNSISWSNGVFFSFKNAINKILNKSNGVVGYDNYVNKINQIDKNIENISKNNQEIISNTNKSIIEKTKDSEIFNKRIHESINIIDAPGDVLLGDTLFMIITKFQRWVNKFKYANGINLSKNFSDANSKQYINNNDTVESAFAKIQYILKNPTTAANLPENWSIGAQFKDGKFDTTQKYTAFREDGFPVAGDSVFYAFAKIVDFIQGLGKHGTLSSDWNEIVYSGEVLYPNAGDTLDSAFQKIVAKFRQIGYINFGVLESINHKTIFNLNNGYLKFIGSDSKSWSLFNADEININNGGDVFKVSKEGMKYQTDITNLYANNMYSSILFETTNETYDGNSCTLQAIANGSGRNTYDAFFSRLKIGSFTFNTIFISSQNYYISRDKGFVIWNGTSTGNFYLPNKPENGLMILIAQSSSTGFNVYAQGKDEIDTINESSQSVGINERGCVFAFIYISGISYSGKNTDGLWQCCKWDNKF